MEKVYIGIGSNIKPKENIKKVKNKIEKYFHCNFSETYKYKSAGFEGYDFLNLVACFFTDLKQEELLQILSKIEKDLGRDEDQRGYSNRVIDIDLLLFGNKINYERDKFLPHKNIENCRFVLEPLADLAGDEIHPVHNKSFKQMLAELKD